MSKLPDGKLPISAFIGITIKFIWAVADFGQLELPLSIMAMYNLERNPMVFEVRYIFIKYISCFGDAKNEGMGLQVTRIEGR